MARVRMAQHDDLNPADRLQLRPSHDRGNEGIGQGPGLIVVLSGEVAVTQHSIIEPDRPIVTHSAGSFLGELAQLAGRPALVDARATRPVEALVIATRRIPELLVAEADTGERIMRALILR